MQRPSGWAICKTIAAVSIPASFLQDLLQRVDIVDVVGRYVPLKKSGANFMGLCPFHGEKSPSFSVSPVKQFFHCFGCGKGGDAIAFLREHTGMEFMEAVQSLAQEVGMQVPQEDISPQQRAQRQAMKQQQDSLVDTLERAAQAYCEQLKNAPHAIERLRGPALGEPGGRVNGQPLAAHQPLPVPMATDAIVLLAHPVRLHVQPRPVAVGQGERIGPGRSGQQAQREKTTQAA